MRDDTPAARAEAEASRAKAKKSALIDKSQNRWSFKKKAAARKDSAGPESVLRLNQQNGS